MPSHAGMGVRLNRERPRLSEEQDQSHTSGGTEKSGRERRLHLQAYEYWYGLLDGRRFPSISDMAREQIDLFRPQSFLVDFPQRHGDPALRFVGDDIMAEYEGEGDLVGISVNKVPVESILSRLSVHYMEVLSNRAPISFEAEFESSHGKEIFYRGILLPFSDDDEDIHFIMGILTWEDGKVLAKTSPGFGKAGLDQPAQDGESEGETVAELSAVEEAADDRESPEVAPQEEVTESLPPESPEAATEPEAVPALALTDLLQHGRDRARSVGHVDARSRDRLYTVLADALALYEAAQQDPETYQRTLAEAGIRQQARAPLTPVIKLIFGSQYDKTRITEYATALKYAIAEGQTSATVKNFIASHQGGIKGCVRSARLARRAASGDDSADAYSQAVKKLRDTPALGSTELDLALSEDDEFVLLLGRKRAGEGGADIIAVLEEKEASLEALLKRASRQLK